MNTTRGPPQWTVTIMQSIGMACILLILIYIVVNIGYDQNWGSGEEEEAGDDSLDFQRHPKRMLNELQHRTTAHTKQHSKRRDHVVLKVPVFFHIPKTSGKTIEWLVQKCAKQLNYTVGKILMLRIKEGGGVCHHL